MLLYKKLFDIDRYGHKRALLKRKPLFEFNKEVQLAYKKNEIIKLTQENLLMLKRLTEKVSLYNNKKMKKDYLKSQNYKKYSCEFKPIDFIKSHKKIQPKNIKMKLKNENVKKKTMYKTISGNNRQIKNINKKKFEFFGIKDLLSDRKNKEINNIKSNEY
jgi:hypothetical protein